MRKLFIFLLLAFFLSKVFCFELYKDKVVVSYYAEKFHGRKTANGERFNMYAMTCAHKSLPFNTIIRVTNLANGKYVDVRVNDRGPFVVGREVDLSKGAAVKLGMIKTGTAKAKIHIVKMGPMTKQSLVSAQKAKKIPLEKSKASIKSTKKMEQRIYKNGILYDIQLGSFSDEKKAREYAQKIAKAKIKNVALQKTSNSTKVVVIKVDGKNVPSMINLLEINGFNKVLVKERKNKKSFLKE